MTVLSVHDGRIDDEAPEDEDCAHSGESACAAVEALLADDAVLQLMGVDIGPPATDACGRRCASGHHLLLDWVRHRSRTTALCGG